MFAAQLIETSVPRISEGTIMRAMGIVSMLLMLAVMIVPCVIIQSGLVKIEKGRITVNKSGDSWAAKKVHGLAESVINLLPKEGVNAVTGRGEDDLFRQQNASKGETEPESQADSKPVYSESDMPVVVVSGGKNRKPSTHSDSDRPAVVVSGGESSEP
jgi:hypothetical protein